MTHLLSADFFTSDFPLYIAEMQHGTIATHQHEFFELVYLLNGQGVHRIGGATYPIHAGDVYMISPNEPHAYYPPNKSEVRIVNVLFLPSLLDESLFGGELCGLTRLLYIEPLFRAETRFSHRLNLQGALAYRVEQLLREMEGEQRMRAPGYAIVLKNLFCTLLVLLSRAYEQQIRNDEDGPALVRHHAVVEAALRYIEAHYTEQVSLAEVARHTATSPSRFAHLFKQHTRRSLLAYLHEYRIGRISAGLLDSEAPISELATNLGYGDLRFFYRVFRRQMGCSPSEYRHRFRHAQQLVDGA